MSNQNIDNKKEKNLIQNLYGVIKIIYQCCNLVLIFSMHFESPQLRF
jgi:hypothetical protein